MSPVQLFGIMALLHAAYSSYEWVRLYKLLGEAPPVRVPVNIVVEAVIGLVLVLIATISGSVSRMVPEYVATTNALKTMESEEPYAYLETRPNFQDIVARRKEYLDWRKQQSAASASQKS